MEELIDIRLRGIDQITAEWISSVKKIFSNVIEKGKVLEIWDDSIIKIIVTNNLSEEVYQQAEIWNIKTEIPKTKEYSVVSKVLFNNNLEKPEYVLFIDFGILLNEKYSLAQILYSQILSITAKSLFQREILDIQFTPQPSTLNTYITVSAIEWIKTYYTSKTISKIFEKPNPPMNHNSFLNAFKRSLKRDLFNYNSDTLLPDENHSVFWNNYYGSIHNLFIRIAENETDKDELMIKDVGCEDLIYGVFEEIKKITSELVESGKFEITILKEKVKQFSDYFEVHLENETEDDFTIRLTKNPKDYFKDLIDTEPRIVCFLDILGFSEFVDRYDNDITSNLLQELQESFASARVLLLENKNEYNEEAIKHLQYQTFSDNVCISIPYFDNENDFLSNFNILSIFVRGLQLIMMSKGFFLRGGISIGSYYADKNIIFSKGLINAYKLESEQAIYPRIVIDKVIIQKIVNYSESKMDIYNLKKAIIFDWENQAFLNPIGLLDATIQQFTSIMSEAELDSDDQFSALLSSLTQTLGKLTKALLESASTGEIESLNLIKRNINQYLIENQYNERIYSKYLWLGELFKWLESEGTEKLKFRFLSDYYEKKD